MHYVPAPTDAEPLPYVDNQDNVIGVLPRAEIHRRALWHRAVHVLVRNPDSHLVIQQRSGLKDIYPHLWECVGGHVGFDERYEDAASREVREELGVAALDLRPLLIHAPSLETGWEFVHVFRATISAPPAPNAQEVINTKTLAFDEVCAAIDNATCQFSPSFLYTMQHLRSGEITAWLN